LDKKLNQLYHFCSSFKSTSSQFSQYFDGFKYSLKLFLISSNVNHTNSQVLKFKVISSKLFNQENKLTFENFVTQVIKTNSINSSESFITQ